jgi:hypothetical protein
LASNDSGSDTCSEKADKSSHETDEAGSSHIAAQNIESEATRNAEIQSQKGQKQH